MPFSAHGILCALALLLLWRAEELAEACSCAPVHPQQAFCNADVGKCITRGASAAAVVVVFVYPAHVAPGSSPELPPPLRPPPRRVKGAPEAAGNRWKLTEDRGHNQSAGTPLLTPYYYLIKYLRTCILESRQIENVFI